jgi:hypothetical protein
LPSPSIVVSGPLGSSLGSVYAPLPGGIKVARSVPRQVCHDLQGHALAAAFARLDHGFDGAKAAVGFDPRSICASFLPIAAAQGSYPFPLACGDDPRPRRWR